MTPLSPTFFSDKPVVWLRFKVVPEDKGLITEFNTEDLVAFNINYSYSYLAGIAQWAAPEMDWDGGELVWKEFYLE